MTTETRSARRSLFSPVFILSVLVLLAAAFGLDPAVEALIDYYSKEPIELRKSLDDFAVTALPSFRHLSGRGGFASISQTEELGTDDWLNLVFEEQNGQQPADDRPDVLLFVTYYSDPRDQVAHTPEICYRQAGAVVEGITTISVETPDLAPETCEVLARRLEIEQGGHKLILVYFFCCNGKFYHDREQLRVAIGWPGDKHIYFSKVEAVTAWPPGVSRTEAMERCQRLLGEALPILVNEHFPRKEDLKRR